MVRRKGFVMDNEAMRASQGDLEAFRATVAKYVTGSDQAAVFAELRAVCFEAMERHAAFNMWANGQREDGSNLPFMTARERKIGSEEWSAKLREKVQTAEVRERLQVRVDIQWEDD